jgi:hypothetical protein
LGRPGHFEVLIKSDLLEEKAGLAPAFLLPDCGFHRTQFSRASVASRARRSVAKRVMESLYLKDAGRLIPGAAAKNWGIRKDEKGFVGCRRSGRFEHRSGTRS